MLDYFCFPTKFLINNMKSELSLLALAYRFAAFKHSKQRRKGAGNIPYINHPVEVAELLAKYLKSDDTILLIAAILHDTLEDTDTQPNEIEELFGKEVLLIVQEVTDDMTLPKQIRKNKQIEKAPTLSPRAKLIKIADKTCNINDILKTRRYWSNRQKIEYVRWAIEVVEKCRNIEPAVDLEFDKAVERAISVLEKK
jgi:GTP diphosphokinase / guanosine-3',5'-bis(diphosphate) 3'-diphosphatase